MLRSIWDLENTYYHIFNRGVNKQQLFYDDQDRWYFIKTLKKAIEKYGIKIHAMHLMGNHFHLIIYSTQDNLSRAMQNIGRSYAQYFLSKYKDLKKDGHAFRGRFGRKIVDTDSYADVLLNYIHLNAVKDGLSLHPANDRWSSYKFYESGEDSFGILTKGIFKNKFKSFMSDKEGRVIVDRETWNWDPEDCTIGGVVLGVKEFAKKIYESTVRQKTPESYHPQIEKALGLNYSVKSDLLKKYIGSLDLDDKTYTQVMAYSLAQWSELSSIDIGHYMNKSESSIRNIKYRVTKQLEKQKMPLCRIIEGVERGVIL